MAAQLNSETLDVDEVDEPFAWAVPLGASCLVSTWLQNNELRRCSFPFDWAFSSPAMVRDCLSDDFRAFLDAREYVAIGKRGAGVGHKRYSALRLPGSWQGFVFLHHDPLRKRSDHDYLQRCVQRFRKMAHSSKRKLFIFCCIVDCVKALEVVRATGLSSSNLSGESGTEDCSGSGFIDCTVANASSPTGEGASWRHASPAELLRVFDGLRAYGVTNFHLSAITLCTGDASSATREPNVLCCRSSESYERSSVSGESFSLHEVHLVNGDGRDTDPSKFFRDACNEEAFKCALFGNGDRRRSFQLDLQQLDEFQPRGYRDVARKETATQAEASRQSATQLTCRWCGTSGFASRNRLFAHIRGAPECASAAARSDPEGMSALAHSSTQRSFAIFLGYMSDRESALNNLAETLTQIGVLNLHLQYVCKSEDAKCPAVADVIIGTFASMFEGEALLTQMRDIIKQKTPNKVSVHGLLQLAQSRVPDIEAGLQHHFAYIIPFWSLKLGTGDSNSEIRECDEIIVNSKSGAGSNGHPEFSVVMANLSARDAWQRTVYRSFKEVLRLVQHACEKIYLYDNASDRSIDQGASKLFAFDQIKMAERVSLHGDECVIIRMSGRSLTAAQCTKAIALAIGVHHGWISPAALISSPDKIWEFEVPRHLLYFEGLRFHEYERKNGLLFGDGTAPFGVAGEIISSSSGIAGQPAEELPIWRRSLQDDLVNFDSQHQTDSFAAWWSKQNLAQSLTTGTKCASINNFSEHAATVA